MIKAVVSIGKRAGTYIGRVAIRGTGSFNIKTKTNTIRSISHKYCQAIQRIDGYTYCKGDAISSPRMNTGVTIAI